MTENPPISIELLDKAINKALTHVFDVMVKKPIKLVQHGETLDAALLGEGPQVMGCVGFAGDIDGFVHLRFTDTLAYTAAGLILGMTPDEVKTEGFELVKDSIGELTNMSVGAFKNQLCDLGYPCKLTLPTIVRGEKLSVPTVKGATRQVYHFEACGHALIADLQMRAG